MTPEETRRLLALIEHLQAASREAEGRKEWESAVALMKAVVMAQALPEHSPQRLAPEENSANVQGVTGAQLERRGRAIAQGRAAASKDELLLAIAKSQWHSQDAYARKRLRVSPGSLTAYRNGTTPCPRPIADKVRDDLGIGLDYWRKHPRSLVD